MKTRSTRRRQSNRPRRSVRTNCGRLCRREGSTLIESALIMVLLCLILFGAFQVSLLYAGREILDYAASMGARSRAVGFNDFMVHKVIRVASIPNAGPITNPIVDRSSADAMVWETYRPGELITYAIRAQPESPQVEVERSRIPLYLGALHYGELNPILEYERWDDIRLRGLNLLGENQVSTRVFQEYPLQMPLHRAFYRDDTVDLEGEARMDSHYSLYLE